MFARCVLAELGLCDMMIEMKTDNAEAKACVERHGAQRMKRTDCHQVHVFDGFGENKMIRLIKVASAINIADMLTTPVSQQIQERLLQSLSVVVFVP